MCGVNDVVAAVVLAFTCTEASFTFSAFDLLFVNIVNSLTPDPLSHSALIVSVPAAGCLVRTGEESFRASSFGLQARRGECEMVRASQHSSSSELPVHRRGCRSLKTRRSWRGVIRVVTLWCV